MSDSNVAKIFSNSGDLKSLHTWVEGLRGRLIVHSETLDITVSALLAGGHVLLEGPPGVGKTTLAKQLAHSLGCSFSRIQMTSDLLPSEIVGGLIPAPGSQGFEFKRGPIFSQIVLADELNRSSPKTQSALLEAMAEATVSVDGVTHELPKPFFVIATQNPGESHGVFPLAESQLDRFMVHASLDYPDQPKELEVLKSEISKSTRGPSTSTHALKPGELLQFQRLAQSAHIEESVFQYIHQLVLALRTNTGLSGSLSTRALIQLSRVSQGHACLMGRDYVLPTDVEKMAPFTLGHRIFSGEQNSQTLPENREKVIQCLATVSKPK